MGSIYGNRDRKNNNHVTNTQERRINSRSQGYRQERMQKPERKRSNYQQKQVSSLDKLLSNVRFRRFLYSAIVNFFVTAVFIIISILFIYGDSRDIYIKLLMLPLAAFVGGFAMKLINKDTIMNVAGVLPVHLIAFLIFVKPTFVVFLWILFYALNSLIGNLLATVVKNFKIE